eukprot:m.68478 g.68478  ORF g.68478 m.68478 type:complete len:734 (-) comp23959_c0_seq1:137-2338(-)
MLQSFKAFGKTPKHQDEHIPVGEDLFRATGTYCGSCRVTQPFGPNTCATAAAKFKNKQESQLDAANLVVTYEGLFVTTGDDEHGVTSCLIREVSLVWQDPSNEHVWCIIVTEKDQVVSTCHVLHMASADIRIEDCIEWLNKASDGKYPSSLGVYQARYMGSVSVAADKGNDVVNDAAKRIQNLNLESRPVEIVITSTQIRVIDAESGNALKMFSIIEVSFTAIDGKDSGKLSFITNDSRFGLLYCHCFSVQGGKASEIPETIAEAFGIAKELIENSSREQLKELGLLQDVQKGTSGALGVYEVKHIGSITSSKQNSGNDVCMKALAEAREQTKTSEMVIVIISEDSVREIDGLTGEVNRSVLLGNVSFITTIGDKKDIFSYISEDPRLKRVLIHLYEATPNVALNMVNSIQEGFKAVMNKRNSAQVNPFKALTKEREPAPGKLFKCQLHRKDIKPLNVIGAGQFGQVYLAMFKQDTKVAVKTVRLAASEDDKDDFVHEAEVMLELKNEGLVQLIGVAVQQRPWLCVIEFMKYGDLRDVLQTCKERHFTLSLWEQLKILKQICSGLAFMASRRYIHMDIAARNCLIDENNVVKLADFGLTRLLDKGSNRYLLKKTAKLPVRWVAIESLECGIFTEASDVWAYGVLMWEVLSYGVLPFEAVKNIDVKQRVKEGLRLQPPEGCHEGLFALASLCWQVKRNMRPKFAQLLVSLEALEPEAKRASCIERDIGKACQGD